MSDPTGVEEEPGALGVCPPPLLSSLKLRLAVEEEEVAGVERRGSLGRGRE